MCMDLQRYGKKTYGQQFFQQFYQQGEEVALKALMAATLRALMALMALKPLRLPQRDLRELLFLI